MKFTPLLLVLACACSASGSMLHPSDRPEIAPHPYTPELIRERCVEGTTLVFEVRNQDQLFHQRMEFVSATDASAVVETTMLSVAGKVIGEPSSGEATWTELRDHAAYPADATEITETTCAVPAGEFDCWLYRVRQPDGEARYWFSRAHPGPPVQVETEQGGRVTFSMALRSFE